MYPEDDPLLIGEELADAIALLVLDDEAPRESHRHTVYLIGTTLCSELLLGVADGGNLRIGVDDPRDSPVAHLFAPSEDMIDCDHSLTSGRMS